MAKPRNKAVDYAVYSVARTLAAFLEALPVSTIYAIARLAGDLIYRFDSKHRRIACKQIQTSFPHWNQDQIENCARLSFHSMAKLGLEMLLTPRLITPNRWRKHIRFANMAPLIQLLLEQPTGVIMLTGHFGNWEISGYTMATLGFPSMAVARPLDNPYLNDFIMGVRERTGLSILFKKGATRGIDDVLSEKGTVCFIADQDAGRKGLFVNFFGRPASTFRAIALMACVHKVPVVVGYGKRLDDNFTFELGIRRIIRPEEWADQDDEVRWITQTFTSELEAVVRSAPDQYLWAHRRWKHRPDGTKEIL